MKCFYYLRERSRSRKQSSAPVLNEGRTSDLSTSESTSTKRGSKSSSSAVSEVASHRSIPSLYEEKAHNLRVFSFSELRNATNDFSRLLKIGEGGFGSVYKGFVKPASGQGDRVEVAIKKLNVNGLQGHKQWVAEVQFLGVVEHPNLVKLVGYCGVDGERGIQRLLVYEYMTNKTLDDHLFSRALPVLPWNTRLQIVLGAAQGLAYLHGGLEVQVIYRDFKASNVLLDGQFKPKLSDFGLAREGPADGHTHVSTAVVGTYGYADPDYIETGHLTTKSDVWSFGVVLYEILTGRRSLDRERPRSEQKLLDWVKQYPADGKKFFMIMDPRLQNQYSLGAARRIAKLADMCLSKVSKDRPKMSEVINELSQAIQVSESGKPQDTAGESPSTNSGSFRRPNDVDGSKYSQRCMVHLTKLMKNASALGRQKICDHAAGKRPVDVSSFADCCIFQLFNRCLWSPKKVTWTPIQCRFEK